MFKFVFSFLFRLFFFFFFGMLFFVLTASANIHPFPMQFDFVSLAYIQSVLFECFEFSLYIWICWSELRFKSMNVHIEFSTTAHLFICIINFHGISFACCYLHSLAISTDVLFCWPFHRTQYKISGFLRASLDFFFIHLLVEGFHFYPFTLHLSCSFFLLFTKDESIIR